MRIERDGEVALIRLENGKANAIGPSFVDRVEPLLGPLGDARAAVITGQGSTFSAGLDLPALVDLDRVRMRAFVLRFETVMMRVFELPIPLVAAVNGHAVAGGCVLALQADVRIGADREARIGLNETQLGIGLPSGRGDAALAGAGSFAGRARAGGTAGVAARGSPARGAARARSGSRAASPRPAARLVPRRASTCRDPHGEGIAPTPGRRRCTRQRGGGRRPVARYLVLSRLAETALRDGRPAEEELNLQETPICGAGCRVGSWWRWRLRVNRSRKT